MTGKENLLSAGDITTVWKGYYTYILTIGQLANLILAYVHLEISKTIEDLKNVGGKLLTSIVSLCPLFLC